MSDWLEALAELKAKGLPVALVTVIRVDGSTPRLQKPGWIISSGSPTPCVFRSRIPK